jgi:predicted DNA-binding protein (MmcQ/YjbR family)
MDLEWLQETCLSLPGTTEQVQWENDLLFKVGGKMFAVTALEPSAVWLCFKASSENFAELTERPSIIPAPYLARAKWVALEARDALPPDELARLLRDSYDMVFAKLTKKTRDAITNGKRILSKARSRKSGKKKSRHSR